MTDSRTGLARLNSLPKEEAEAELIKCCGSKKWAQRLTAQRPFANVDHLNESAHQVWWALDPADWLKAFHSHPKIGEKKAAAPTSDQSNRWSEAEQAGVSTAAPETLQELADLNRVYEEKFGYIYIVSAAGKSTDELLRILRARLKHPADQELHNAAAEQAKITQLRLKKLIDS